MVAARLLGVNFSLALHGSDLLLDGAYLDTKLKNCRFCVTISEYNRRYILDHFPAIDPTKIVVSRLGVDVPEHAEILPRKAHAEPRVFTLFTVGRLHAVKDHAFLVRACARLRDRGLDFECVIAGEGPQRKRLELLIRENQLQDRITLLGHVLRSELYSLYRRADVVVLTSRSEGIPLVAHGGDGTGQNRARARDHGDPGACHCWKNRLPLCTRGAGGLRGADFLPAGTDHGRGSQYS